MGAVSVPRSRLDEARLGKVERQGAGQYTLPDTVGHLSTIIEGTTIGAISTPFHVKQVTIDGYPGISVVTQMTDQVSALAHLAPYGAIALAAKLLEEVTRFYVGRPWMSDCPPKLATAPEAAQDAFREVKTMPRPTP